MEIQRILKTGEYARIQRWLNEPRLDSNFCVRCSEPLPSNAARCSCGFKTHLTQAEAIQADKVCAETDEVGATFCAFGAVSP